MPIIYPPPPPVNPGIDRKLRVLVACEFSGRVREAFTRRGHYAMSCDYLPTEIPGEHYRGDVRDVIGDGWDMMVAFPPCTYLSVAGNAHAKYNTERRKLALDFVRMLMQADIRYIAIENPVGAISSNIRKPDQIIQPWMFGDPWVKRTCLWIKNLPLLIPDKIVENRGHWVDGGTGVKNKDREYGDAKYGSTSDKERKMQRSMTFQGIARVMSEQWG